MIWVFNTVALIILLCTFSLLVVWHQLISPHFEILAWKQEQIKWGWKFFLSEWLSGWEYQSLKRMCDSWSTTLLLVSVCEGESFQGGDIKKGVVQFQPRWYPNPTPPKLSRARCNPNPNKSSPTDLLTHHCFPSYIIETNRIFTTKDLQVNIWFQAGGYKFRFLFSYSWIFQISVTLRSIVKSSPQPS